MSPSLRTSNTPEAAHVSPQCKNIRRFCHPFSITELAGRPSRAPACSWFPLLHVCRASLETAPCPDTCCAYFHRTLAYKYIRDVLDQARSDAPNSTSGTSCGRQIALALALALLSLLLLPPVASQLSMGVGPTTAAATGQAATSADSTTRTVPAYSATRSTSGLHGRGLLSQATISSPQGCGSDHLRLSVMVTTDKFHL